MTNTGTAAPRSAAARTRVIKSQLAQLDLDPRIVSLRVLGGQLHTVFADSADDRELIADVLDALEWGPAADRSYDGFVALFVPTSRMAPRA
jgi:predicted membrane-bound spermidine synthase